MTATAAVDFFSRSVRERLFAPQSSERRRIGLEVEMLPQLTDSGLPCPLETPEGGTRSTLAFLRPYGASRGWRERRSAKGAPYFALPNGSTLTFEPGGQLELCTSATEAISSLLRATTETVTALRSAASDAGITLLSVGIDPENGIERVPLQLYVPRYVEMTRYFDRIGPSGVRMMRQTAATQVSVDPGAEPGERWRLLADLTPYLTAIFANSPRYAGEDTGWRSYRAQCWRQLDHSRTGIPHPELAAEEAYTRFALEAVDMTRADAAGDYRSFAEWAEHGEWTVSQWENHLTTLFPEVRPRGHLEVRSIDALAPEVAVAAVVIIAGIAYDERATREARALLPTADEEMLNRAARCGLRDDGIARTALSVAELGLAGAQTLGDGVVAGAELEVAKEFVAGWTRCRRSPADGC
jgi:glutamate--cysteine ligase